MATTKKRSSYPSNFGAGEPLDESKRKSRTKDGEGELAKKKQVHKADVKSAEAGESTSEKAAKTAKKGAKRAADAVEGLTDASAAEKATKKAKKSKTAASRASKPSGEEAEPPVSEDEDFGVDDRTAALEDYIDSGDEGFGSGQAIPKLPKAKQSSKKLPPRFPVTRERISHSNVTTITVPPQEDPNDYNIRLEERTRLLMTIKSLLSQGASPTFWAGCQLGDLQQLGALVNSNKTWNGLMDYLNKSTQSLPLLCKSTEFI
jgi:hypothetical protein